MATLKSVPDTISHAGRREAPYEIEETSTKAKSASADIDAAYVLAVNAKVGEVSGGRGSQR
jgi:hypothetical protein